MIQSDQPSTTLLILRVSAIINNTFLA